MGVAAEPKKAPLLPGAVKSQRRSVPGKGNGKAGKTLVCLHSDQRPEISPQPTGPHILSLSLPALHLSPLSSLALLQPRGPLYHSQNTPASRLRTCSFPRC